LDILRRCPLRDIRSVLNELPETLDETYKRILQCIPKKMQKDAHRIFQWLTVSSRPPHIKELAEVFAMNFDAETSGIPRFDSSWRPSNAEASVLSACSTLVSIVHSTDWRGRRETRVQFAHFSVKEYLTSDRIANSALVSHFYILPKPAHTLLAKACLSTLIQLDDSIDETKIQNFPLAKYAAEYWVHHTRFEDVFLDLQDGVDCLFDKNKPHLATWIWLYDVEDNGMAFDGDRSPHPTQPDAVPLYFAALCGIRDLVERLLDAHPQDLNTQGGYFKTPLLAALAKGYPSVALFLLERGADVQPRGGMGQTALYMASSLGYTELVRSLLDRGADLNAVCDDLDEDGCYVKLTPLLVASEKGRLETAMLLLESGADMEPQGGPDQTALYVASSRGHAEVVRLLLDRGADPNALCDDWDECGCQVKFAPLLVASRNDMLEVARLLLEKDANSNYKDNHGSSALHLASRHASSDLARLFLDRGANPNAGDKWGNTALHEASSDARDEEGSTPLHRAAIWGRPQEVAQLLLDHGADVNAQEGDRWTALHLAAQRGHHRVVEVLLERGADPHARTNEGKTPFQVALGNRYGYDTTQVRRLLSERTGERMEDVGMRD
jgi:ankyrin repeat protein